MQPPSIGVMNLPIDQRNLLEDIIRTLSNISFGDGLGSKDQNIDARIVSGVSNGAPNTESVHAHNLKRTPLGFIIISQDKAGSFYNSANPNTSSELKLRCSVASVTFKALIF